MIYKTFTVFIIFALSGCATLIPSPSSPPSPYQLTVDDYILVAPKVSLGMSKDQVVEILQPSQFRLKNTEIKQSDMYKKDNILVEILYFRSGWQSDGVSTDDEYTPYLFNDSKLVAIGWVILGGAKSHGQVMPQTNVHTTTVVTPTTIIY